jgi:hypothetical protein
MRSRNNLPSEMTCPHCGDTEPIVLGLTWVRDADGTLMFRCHSEAIEIMRRKNDTGTS